MANRELLSKNKVEGQVDDYIYLNIKMAAQIDSDKTVPCQLKLPNSLYDEKNENNSVALLIVKEKPEDVQEMVQEMGLNAITKVVTITQIK